MKSVASFATTTAAAGFLIVVFSSAFSVSKWISFRSAYTTSTISTDYASLLVRSKNKKPNVLLGTVNKNKEQNAFFPNNPTGECPSPRYNWTSGNRSKRFLSRQIRICHYMHKWYDPRFSSSNSTPESDDSTFHLDTDYDYVAEIDGTNWSRLQILTPNNLTFRNVIYPAKLFHFRINTVEEDDMFNHLIHDLLKEEVRLTSRIRLRSNMRNYAVDLVNL